ncbi:MAG: HAMP domain-containing protein [Fusobacteriaceae bacterium]|nr:HAMP domain-containing protein [Fusobacteriaceae bacterium]
MRYSLNKRIFFMISLVLLIVFSLLFFLNEVFLSKYYRMHKKAQIISVADEIKEINYQDIRDIGEQNNLRIEILNELQLRATLNRFSRGPFSDFEKDIRVKDLSKDRVILTFQGKGKQNNEMMILLIEKIEDDSFVVIYSPVYSIGEALKVSSDFTLLGFFFAIFLSVVVSIVVSRKISKPILEISFVAEKIANLQFDKTLQIIRDDEVGDLAKAINKMSNSLRFIIEDLKISNERLKMEIQKEKEIDKMRREFISNVNHELKTPIALIKGFTEGLKDNIASPEDREYYLDVIDDECNNMDMLVKRLLLLSKYESEFEIKKEELDIKNLLDELLKRYKIEYDKKNIKIEVEIGEQFLLIADYKELKIAIDNLFRNAINYTEENKTIKIYCNKEGEREIFSIINPYKEMTSEEIEKLWIPFNKADKARTRKFGGTGLGLSIVAAIMKKHGFTYGASYENGEIKFYFYDERTVTEKES